MFLKNGFSIIVTIYNIIKKFITYKKNINTYKIIRFHVDLIEIAPGPRITR